MNMNKCHAHAIETKERIAFELMLKIANCDLHCKQTLNPDSKNESDKTESESTDDSSGETRGKSYWLKLYADCLAVVKQQKVKK